MSRHSPLGTGLPLRLKGFISAMTCQSQRQIRSRAVPTPQAAASQDTSFHGKNDCSWQSGLSWWYSASRRKFAIDELNFHPDRRSSALSCVSRLASGGGGGE